MLYDVWARAQAKWRGILVYTLLHAVARFVTAVIYTRATTPGLQIYASLVLLFTSLYCFIQISTLITRDRSGDEAWPPLWS